MRAYHAAIRLRSTSANAMRFTSTFMILILVRVAVSTRRRVRGALQTFPPRSTPHLFTSPSAKNTRHPPPLQQDVPHQDNKHRHKVDHSHTGYSDMLLCVHPIP